MALFTKCILAPKEKHDGLRISIMSRHTLSDGITNDSRITPLSYDLHMPLFAPSIYLIGDYYKRNLSWKDFENRYLLEIEQKYHNVLALAKRALKTNVTLLCIEDIPNKCHRRLLAEECKRLVPELSITCK